MLSWRQFYRSKDPTNSIKSTEGKDATKVNPENANNTKYSNTMNTQVQKNPKNPLVYGVTRDGSHRGQGCQA